MELLPLIAATKEHMAATMAHITSNNLPGTLMANVADGGWNHKNSYLLGVYCLNLDKVFLARLQEF